MFRLLKNNTFLNTSKRLLSTSVKPGKVTEIKINPGVVVSSLFFTGTGLYLLNNSKVNVNKINWIELKKMLENSEIISKIELHDNKVARIFKDDSIYLMNINDNKYTQDKIEKINENVIIENIPPHPLQGLVSTIIPSAIFFGIFLYMMRRQQGGVMNFLV